MSTFASDMDKKIKDYIWEYLKTTDLSLWCLNKIREWDRDGECDIEEYIPSELYQIDTKIKDLLTDIDNFITNLSSLKDPLDTLNTDLSNCNTSLSTGYILDGQPLDKGKLADCITDISTILSDIDTLKTDVENYKPFIESACDVWNDQLYNYINYERIYNDR